MAKSFKKMNSIEQAIFELKTQVQMRMSEKNYEALVGLVFKLKQEIHKIRQMKNVKDVEQKAHFDNIRLQAEGFICDLVTSIAKDLTELFQFSYELRKQDQEDQYTYELLNGAVKPCILVDIITNNVWLKSKKMGLKKELTFRLMLTFNDQKYTLCYDSSSKPSAQSSLPLAMKDKSFQGNKELAHSVKIVLVKKGI